MRFSSYDIVLQEVPNEVSLCFTITGCQIRCNGCHSPYIWKKESGTLLTKELFDEILNKYSGLITCVLFMGGEWYKDELIYFLSNIKNKGLKTCLYTGLDDIDDEIKNELTFLKVGPWISELGGLRSKSTNQKFIDLRNGEILNHIFINYL